jgi:predicted phosphodiesterase
MSARTRTALVLSDWQVDLHDEGFIEKTLKLAKDLQPDKIIHVGDESDNTAIGRWVQGTPEEAEGNLQTQIDITHSLLRKFREACPDATFDICYSNHMARFTQSITTRLPAFRHLRALSVENLFGLDELEISYRREIFEVFPDVIAGHGHQWGLTSANQYTKGTSVVAKTGKSVVAGHTHRPLLTSAAVGYNFNMQTNFYMNVGCSMRFSAAEYITSKSPEWGHGVGVLTWNRTLDRTMPELLVAQNGRFYYKGTCY